MTIGYTTGVYDLFHIGHLNLLKSARGMCDRLIVGVTVDELVTYKGKRAMIPFEDRIEIVRSCRYVDAAVPQYDMDKLAACRKLGAQVLFVGDDWYGTDKWREYEERFAAEGIRVVYFPYTKGISSTKVSEALRHVRGWTDGPGQDAGRADSAGEGGDRMTDKAWCMSSYLAFRYIERDGVDFYDGMRHRNIELPPESGQTAVRTAGEIGAAIERQLAQFRGKRVGVMLSGGMDSAIVASYVPGAEAYTFRFLGGEFQGEELSRAERYARQYGLRLHHVDISWQTVESHVDDCMRRKCAPVHSIEPQLLQAALQAKADGVEMLLIGDGSDYVFGGMDKLLAKDWDFDEFVERYYAINPKDVLKQPVDMTYPFEPFRLPGNKIDFWGFMQGLMTRESYNSYYNAFAVAGMPYYDPYARLRMAEPLDLRRVRAGEPKYLIRELMAMRYPGMGVPDKNPMPRPVDTYFAGWEGPRRPEFREGLDMAKFTGNQKWQMWCLERWLDMNEPLTGGGMNI